MAEIAPPPPLSLRTQVLRFILTGGFSAVVDFGLYLFLYRSGLQVDLVLVPLLAFDTEGFRVGYGKGFYDRYLANCRADVVTIGFSYFGPVDKITDTGQFDVPLTYCITPQHTYEF